MNTGFLVSDQVFITEDVNVDIVFGCNQIEVYDHDDIKDGVFALGREDLFDFPSILEFLHDENEISNESYSVCFGPEGGFLSVGKHHKDDAIEWAELIDDYYFEVTGLKVADLDTDVEPEDFINLLEQMTYVDSTTRITLVRDDVFWKLFDTFDKYCEAEEACLGYPLDESDKMSYCYKHNPEEMELDAFFDSFPTIKVELEAEIEIEWLPKYYFVPFKH